MIDNVEALILVLDDDNQIIEVRLRTMTNIMLISFAAVYFFDK